MSLNEWAAVAVALITLLSAIHAYMRFMTKSLMRELSPNSGKSLKDQVSRIEQRLDELILNLAMKD